MKYLSSSVEVHETIIVQYENDEEKFSHGDVMIEDGWKFHKQQRNIYYWYRIKYQNETPEELLNTIGGDKHDDVGNP